jgi:hypothetical protein
VRSDERAYPSNRTKKLIASCQEGPVNLNFAFIVMGAVEDEGTFWIQLLMLVMLAAGACIYFLVKSRAKHVERHTYDEVIETIIDPPAVSSVSLPKPLAIKHPAGERPAVSEIEPHRKDLTGGMELLARNFLVSIVERIDSADQRDIAMRCLCFNELVRRGQLAAIASVALKVYTLDEDGFYGKVISCKAMAELAGRTLKEPENTAETHTSLPAEQEQPASAAHHAD